MFFCSSLLNSKTTWLSPEELEFEAKKTCTKTSFVQILLIEQPNGNTTAHFQANLRHCFNPPLKQGKKFSQSRKGRKK